MYAGVVDVNSEGVGLATAFMYLCTYALVIAKYKLNQVGSVGCTWVGRKQNEMD
jgi:hypothetical protein